MQTKLFHLVFCLALAPSLAEADKLDDFKEAVNNQGCDSIPYSDLRSSCRSQQSDVHPWCDGDRGPVKCEANVTRALRTKESQERRQLDELKDKRRDADDKRSRATDDSERSKWKIEAETLDRSIDAGKKRLEDLTGELLKRKDQVEKTIYTLNKCIDYRVAVMNIFSYATDKVRGESEPDVRPFAETLRNRYPIHIKGHQEQIDNRKNSIETCKTELP